MNLSGHVPNMTVFILNMISLVVVMTGFNLNNIFFFKYDWNGYK